MEEQKVEVVTGELVTPEQEQALALERNVHVAAAEKFEVTCYEDMEVLSEKRRGMKVLLDKISSVFKPIYDAQRAVAKLTKEKWDGLAEPLEKADKLYKGKAEAFELEQEELREKQRRKEAEEAKKKQEDMILNSAVELESAGMKDAAEAVLNMPMPVVMPRAAQPVKVSGTVFRDKWSAEVFDLTALIKAVAEGRAPTTYLMADTTALDRTVAAQKQGFTCPGVRAVKTKIAARSRE